MKYSMLYIGRTRPKHFPDLPYPGVMVTLPLYLRKYGGYHGPGHVTQAVSGSLIQTMKQWIRAI